MKTVLIGCKQNNVYIDNVTAVLQGEGFQVDFVESKEQLLNVISNNARIGAVLLGFDLFSDKVAKGIVDLNEDLPIFALKTSEFTEGVDFNAVGDHARLIDCCLYSEVDLVNKVLKSIEVYVDKIMPPLTKALFKFVQEDKDTFCTPGHMGGTAYQRSPAGSIFYDFYGENTMKSDISISVGELGSLLDHTGPHGEAEKYIAETFNADRSYIVTNGTSTANKIVGQFSVPAGETALIDRNCHKSLTHMLMMSDIVPVYLKPTRNAYGLLGGIPESEFSKEAINAKVAETPGAKWPVHSIVTNSTYDGLFYNTDKIKEILDVRSIHFDSAWVPYTNFSPIYNGLTGMGGKRFPNKVIYETQSTHKLLAAFSQASMIHVKGEICVETFGEAYMMQTSTSPHYGIVASTEMAAAMMRGNTGKRLIQDSIDRAMKFRRDMKQRFNESKTWYFDVWQPANVDTVECWELKKDDAWHGFKNIDKEHMYLDPIKVTLLTPGLDKNGKLEKTGIPASLVSKFLDDRGVIVEKTGIYNILVLFSIGIDDTKTVNLIRGLNEFKTMYDNNAFVKDMLPNIYKQDESFYEGMRIQELAQGIHALTIKHNLPELMFSAFDVLPKIIMKPSAAFQAELRGEIEDSYLDEMMGKINANMILPYPPGVPLVMPGEMITEESKPILEFMKMLCDIGSEYPGFATDIHGAYPQADGRYKVKVIVQKK